MSATMVLDPTRLSVLLLSLTVATGCGGDGASSPDAAGHRQASPGGEAPVNYKDTLARCRFRLDQMRTELQRLEEQRLDLIARLTHGGTLTLDEAQKQQNWTFFARQLKSVTDRQHALKETAGKLQDVIPKLEYELTQRSHGDDRSSVTDAEWQMIFQANREMDDASKTQADTGVAEDFELDRLLKDQLPP